ncbi:MAG: coproporphyrinogen III oxidase family protein, partial [Chloroflexi bacterium]|nr:coproporphyrinogen III oxidase family protein [Chloroflexota bacterium]
PYCDFVVYSGRAARGPASRVAAYVGALRTELELRADLLDERFGAQRPPLRSVYLGGGTPSLLPAREIELLLKRVATRFGLAPDAELTIEANPGPDELGDLAGFRAAGCTRLSLGVQSLDPAELRRVGRRHGGDDALTAVRAARAAGLASVSVDLLYDIPGQTRGSWEATLGSVLAAGVDHVSAYALTLDDPDAEGLTGPAGDHLPVRRGARGWRERAREAQDDDRAADLYELADARLAEAGRTWYEISNWALPGHQSTHNRTYWEHLPYEALGPGAHAHDGARMRRWNAARLEGYLAALAPPDGSPAKLPPGGVEELDEDALLREGVVLGLRLRRGVGPEFTDDPRFAPVLAWASGVGLLERAGDARLRFTLRGRLLSSEVFVRLAATDSARLTEPV